MPHSFRPCLGSCPQCFSSHFFHTMSKKVEIEVKGKKVAVSNLEKVLYPEAGFTKGQVIDYYIRIAPVLLPHLKNRPITLKRYPDGVEGFFFYEKQCPPRGCNYTFHLTPQRPMTRPRPLRMPSRKDWSENILMGLFRACRRLCVKERC